MLRRWRASGWLDAGLTDERVRAFLDLLDPVAETAGECVSLRWGGDLRFWSRRLDAARTADRAALWESTLAGVQRLAALARA